MKVICSLIQNLGWRERIWEATNERASRWTHSTHLGFIPVDYCGSLHCNATSQNICPTNFAAVKVNTSDVTSKEWAISMLIPFTATLEQEQTNASIVFGWQIVNPRLLSMILLYHTHKRQVLVREVLRKLWYIDSMQFKSKKKAISNSWSHNLNFLEFIVSEGWLVFFQEHNTLGASGSRLMIKF